jgi:hypothetical protein
MKMVPGNKRVLDFMHRLRTVLGVPSNPPFKWEGQYYDGNKYELVNDPSDVPPYDWVPPGGDWKNWRQDKMLVRREQT